MSEGYEVTSELPGRPVIVINVSVQHNGGFLPGIISYSVDPMLLPYFRRTRLNAMKRFCICSLHVIPPKRLAFFPPDWGMLRRSGCVQIFL